MWVLGEEMEIPGGDDKRNGDCDSKGNNKGKGNSQYGGPSPSFHSGQDDDEKLVSRLLGGEEVALVEEAGGLGFGFGLEDEAGA